MLTEEEARKKWCPNVRLNGGGAPFNRFNDGDDPPGALCMASACMSWRWWDGGYGYCGLAGKP
jgi:hypothetical protein